MTKGKKKIIGNRVTRKHKHLVVILTFRSQKQESSLIFHIQFSVPCFNVSTRRNHFLPLFQFTTLYMRATTQLAEERRAKFSLFRLTCRHDDPKKIRRYRIKVYSTPRWSSRNNQLGPIATLTKWKTQSLFFPCS